MEYEIHQVNGELTHWGIKGMRWGIRRYQNKDGSLTAAGRKRYDDEMEKVKAETKKIRNQQRVAKKMTKLDEAKQKLADLKKGKKSSDDEKTGETDEQKRERILKNPSAKDVYENRHLFSNKEVGELQLRLIQEENIKKLIPAEVDPRQQKMDNFTKGLEKATATGLALGKAYNLGATVFNAFSSTTLPKLDLDSMNKGNKKERREEAEAAKKADEANKEKAAKQKAVENAAREKKKAEKKAAREEKKAAREEKKAAREEKKANSVNQQKADSGKTFVDTHSDTKVSDVSQSSVSTGKAATDNLLSSLGIRRVDASNTGNHKSFVDENGNQLDDWN